MSTSLGIGYFSLKSWSHLQNARISNVDAPDTSTVSGKARSLGRLEFQQQRFGRSGKERVGDVLCRFEGGVELHSIPRFSVQTFWHSSPGGVSGVVLHQHFVGDAVWCAFLADCFDCADDGGASRWCWLSNRFCIFLLPVLLQCFDLSDGQIAVLLQVVEQ